MSATPMPMLDAKPHRAAIVGACHDAAARARMAGREVDVCAIAPVAAPA